MLSSSRFIVAIHALSVLARYAGRGPVCSNQVAQSVNTNPVVIRRLMSDLEKANLVTSAAGRTGGFSLARSADGISLADIYRAVEDETIFRMHKTDPHSECPIGAQICKVLAGPLQAAESALAASLAGTTLKDISARIAAPAIPASQGV
jgi:Rrf2 family protein